MHEVVRPKSWIHAQHQQDEQAPCYALLRIGMFVFTVLFWILAIIVLAIGIALRADGEFRMAVANHVPGAVFGAGMLIFVGVAMLLTGFIACFGAIRESKCLLLTFFLILFVTFILLVACAIWSDAARSGINRAIVKKLETDVSNYYSSFDSRDAMDQLQRELKCCGAREGGTDYQKLVPQSGAAPQPIPRSCGKNITPRSACFYRILETLDSQLGKVAGTGVTVAIILIIGMVLSLTLCWQLHEFY